jgi:hypothetical protein
VADEDPRIASLAHLVGFARFWIASYDTYPQEQQLLQQLMSGTAADTVPVDEATRVVPTVLRLLGLAEERFAAAASAGALSDADPMDRTIVLAAALSGVLQVGKLAHWDDELLDGPRLGGQLLDDLLRGWGADPALLAAAQTIVDAVARRHPLARPLPDGDAQ